VVQLPAVNEEEKILLLLLLLNPSLFLLLKINIVNADTNASYGAPFAAVLGGTPTGDRGREYNMILLLLLLLLLIPSIFLLLMR
jgi:hypothetical protein